MAINLTTVARVRAFDKTIVAAVTDAQITVLIQMVSAHIEGILGRETEATTYTVYLSPGEGQEWFSLRAYPITSITSVTYDTDRVFTDSNDVLTATTDYIHDADTGELWIDNQALAKGNRTLKVVYVGGMAADTAAFITAYPDVAGAADMIVAHTFHQEGNASMATLDDGITSATIRPMVIPPQARSILEGHKRRLF